MDHTKNNVELLLAEINQLKNEITRLGIHVTEITTALNYPDDTIIHDQTWQTDNWQVCLPFHGKVEVDVYAEDQLGVQGKYTKINPTSVCNSYGTLTLEFDQPYAGYCVVRSVDNQTTNKYYLSNYNLPMFGHVALLWDESPCGEVLLGNQQQCALPYEVEDEDPLYAHHDKIMKGMFG